MNNLSYFLKENKMKKENVKFKASNAFKDEKGEILAWEIKHITSKENDVIRDACVIEVPYKKGAYRQKLDTSKYIAKLICESVVYPNLNSKDLQDSYGVMSAEELIFELIDSPSEYNRLAEFIQEINGFDVDINEKIEQSKN